MRSDLFNRPLDRTLITDFLGGVAHAEVLDSVPDAPPYVAPELSDEDLGLSTLREDAAVNVSAPVSELDEVEQVGYYEHAVVSGWAGWWGRAGRIVASQAIVGGLVALAFFRSSRT